MLVAGFLASGLAGLASAVESVRVRSLVGFVVLRCAGAALCASGFGVAGCVVFGGVAVAGAGLLVAGFVIAGVVADGCVGTGFWALEFGGAEVAGALAVVADGVLRVVEEPDAACAVAGTGFAAEPAVAPAAAFAFSDSASATASTGCAAPSDPSAVAGSSGGAASIPACRRGMRSGASRSSFSICCSAGVGRRPSLAAPRLQNTQANTPTMTTTAKLVTVRRRGFQRLRGRRTSTTSSQTAGGASTT